MSKVSITISDCTPDDAKAILKLVYGGSAAKPEEAENEEKEKKTRQRKPAAPEKVEPKKSEDDDFQLGDEDDKPITLAILRTAMNEAVAADRAATIEVFKEYGIKKIDDMADRKKEFPKLLKALEEIAK